MKSFGDLANHWVSGLGVYEPGRPIEEVARELGFVNVEDVIKLASNENALGPSPRAVRALRKAAPKMHLYPDGGAYYLRQALARKLQVQADQILIGAGSNEIIELLGHVFLDQAVNIVMADRAFVVYKLVASAARAETILVPMRDYTHDLEAMRAAITPATRLVFISNPNNPTGTMVDGEAIERFLQRVPEHVVTVLDEAYVELLPPARQPDVLRHVRAGKKLVVLRTFSKTYGLAGLRVGYGIAPEECIRLLNRVRQPFNVTAAALVAAEAALGDDRHVARTRALVSRGLRYLETEFKEMGLFHVPSAANFILVEVRDGRSMAQALEREGVIVRPMDGYRLPDHVRITVGTAVENRRLIRAMKKVLARRQAGA